MQTNIQQFVKDNQGSLITFLHNDKRVSKVVVDIQGDYFTCKSNASDPKIDGFYYFSDCTFFFEKHPLVEILEKHNVSVLTFRVGHSCIFKYNNYCEGTNYCDGMINGTCLTTSQPVGFNIESVKEAWSIVDGKYTKIWEKQPSTTPIPMDKLSSYFEAQNNVKNACEKVNNTLEKLNNSFDKVFKSIDKEDINYKYPGILSGKAYTRYPNGKVKTEAFYKDGKFHGDHLEYYENGSLFKHTQYKSGLKDGEYFEYDKNNKIASHKYFKHDVEVNGKKEIFYRGKAKTVEVINEYTLNNGKEYVMVKDFTDNGKKKSLFKEYIQWL
jgi:antitoxin component YwqK of YwqJK toxin-antitoxin module